MYRKLPSRPVSCFTRTPFVPAAIVPAAVSRKREVAVGRRTRTAVRDIGARRTMSDIDAPTETATGWLSPEQLELVRANVPLVYVDAIPVRVDGLGPGDRGRHAAAGRRRRLDQPDGRQRPGAVRRAGARRARAPPREGPRAAGPAPPARRPDAVHDRRVLPRPRALGVPRSPAPRRAAWPTSCRSTATASRRRRPSTSPGSRRAEAVGASVRNQMTGGHDRLIRLALAHVGELP